MLNFLKKLLKRKPAASPPFEAGEGMTIWTCSVAGVMHCGYYKKIRKLRLDSTVQLFRDRENKVDPYAVGMKDLSGNMLGYIPADNARVLSEKMDKENWCPRVAVSQLKTNPAGHTTELEIAVIIPEGMFNRQATPLLEYNFSVGKTGYLYVMLNCQGTALLSEITKALRDEGLDCKDAEPASQREVDGHNYEWLIRVLDVESRSPLVNFFRKHYRVERWGTDTFVQYAEEYEKDLSAYKKKMGELDDEIAILKKENKDKISDSAESLKELKKAIVEKFLPDIEILRDSWDIIYDALEKNSKLLAILRDIQCSPEKVNRQRLQSAKSWWEVHYPFTQSNDGRLYYKMQGAQKKLFLSVKGNQTKDVKWMQKN